MKILFFINSLDIGGGEKSLVSLLNTIDYKKNVVDLLMIKIGGEFERYLPKEVNILEVPKYYKYLNDNTAFKLKEKIIFNVIRKKSAIDLRVNRKFLKSKNDQQILYKNQENILESIDKDYDIAIAYAQGFPTYFVADKVNAKEKYAWINCDYKNTMYDKKYDKKFYDKYKKIIAVSENTKKSILEIFPSYNNKITIFKDIINERLILEMANEKLEKITFEKDKFNVVTVARIVEGYKGYDLLVDAANLLNKEFENFKWYIIGDGPDYKKIEKRIEKYNLENKVILVGSDYNPYKYMKCADLYVQTSRVEGFGLTVREAQVLGRKIVCTNFDTAKEIIRDSKNEKIVEINAQSIAEGIKTFIL